MSRRRTRQARRGYVLVMFAMLAFAFFALAALVIDMGMVRLTQRQMQSATDSAALEGLRFRDGIPPYLLVSPWFQQIAELTCGPAPQSAYNPYDEGWVAYITSVNNNRDSLRRLLASQMVSNIFDDDLNPNDTDTSGPNGQPGNWGAGPVVNLSGGVGSDPALAAGQLITLPSTGAPTYNPGQQNGAYPPLQTNFVTTGSASSQQPYGDMVSGTYEYNTSYDGPYNGWSQETAKAASGGTPYVRRDFIPDLAPDEPANDAAFLVRMRRLNPNDFQPGIDDATGVSTYGPPLPFLFARGSMMLPTTATSYQPRLDGLTVRASSIASIDPIVPPSGAEQQPIALSIGGAAAAGVQTDSSGTVTSLGVEGQGSVAVTAPFWLALSTPPVPLNGSSVVPPSAFGCGFATAAIEAPTAAVPNTTLNLVSAPLSPYAPESPGDVSTTSPPPPQPLDFLVQIDSELMRVQNIVGGTAWTVVRGACGTQPAAHEAGTARLIAPLHADGVGNVLSAPVCAAPAAAGQAGITIASPTDFFMFPSLVAAAAGTLGVPALVQGLPTSRITIMAQTYSSTAGFALVTQPIPAPGVAAGAQIDLIMAVGTISSGSADSNSTITVTTPLNYPHYPLPATPFVAIVHDAAIESPPNNGTNSPAVLDPYAEYVRVLSAATGTGPWVVERGLFGTAAVEHSSGTGYLAITPVVGFAPAQPPMATQSAAFGDLVPPPTSEPLESTPLLPLATLATAVQPGTTTINVSTILGFPADPNNNASTQFLVCVEGEVMLVEDFDDSNPTEWTVTSGENSSSPVYTPASAHPVGAVVALLQNCKAPIFDDVVDSDGNEYSGRVLGFGNFTVYPDSPSLGTGFPLARFVMASVPGATQTGTVATGAAATLNRPFAVDLLQASLPPENLWSQFGSTLQTQAQAIQTQAAAAGLSAPNSNTVLAPMLRSTNVPPLQQQ